MTIPGQSSGTQLYDPSDAQIVVDAFDRIQMRPPQLERHHWISARQSLNDLFVEWQNSGVALWKIVNGTIPLVAPINGVGQATYTLPPTLLMLTELWYTVVNGNGAGLNSDRWMEPITRTQYAQLPNKLQTGTPSQYWLQRLIVPQVQIYQTAFAGTPNYQMNWYGLTQIQDANYASGETPDIPYRAIDAMKAGLALRLAEKFKPEQWEAKDKVYQRAWIAFTAGDEEPGPLVFQPNMGNWARIGR